MYVCTEWKSHAKHTHIHKHKCTQSIESKAISVYMFTEMHKHMPNTVCMILNDSQQWNDEISCMYVWSAQETKRTESSVAMMWCDMMITGIFHLCVTNYFNGFRWLAVSLDSKLLLVLGWIFPSYMGIVHHA